MHKKGSIVKTAPVKNVQLAYPCTDCGRDAFIGYTSGKGDLSWDGKIKKGERVCLPCGRKRGIKFF